jgi:outer membrane protein TolC
MRVLRDPHPRLTRALPGGLVAGLTILLGIPASLPAQNAAGAGPVPPNPPAVAPAAAPALTLEDCLHLGRANQPSIQAALASLGSAQAAQRGLNEIRLGFLSRELPMRKQQSAFGVNAAAANLAQVQRDVDASVARMYFSVLYAREQKKVAEQIVARLKATVAVGETLLGKDGAPADLNTLSVERAKLYASLAAGRVSEADRGLARATAALREAMGVCPEFEFQVAEGKLPPPLAGVNKDQLVQLAIAQRGEVNMANSAVCITRLEIQAQDAVRRNKRPTSAAGGDMHARPIPTGSFGDDYKPGAIGLDFPTLFVGPRETRVERATEVSRRADAAADKARNLVALEAEDTFFKWEESMTKIKEYTKAAQDAEALSRRAQSALESGVIQSYRDVLEILVIGAQIQAHLNEALYNHAVVLTELERVTAGGFPTVTVNVP